MRLHPQGTTQQDFDAAERATWARHWILTALIYLGAAIAAGLALYPAAARAELARSALGGRLEVLAGQCRQDKIANGIWFQEGYPHSMDFSSNCAQVGFSFLTGSRGAWSFGWRFAYVDLGTMRFDSTFTMHDTEAALGLDGSTCNPVDLTGCLGRGHGEQRSRGLSVGYLTERAIGPVVLGGDAGLFMYDGRFRASINGVGPAGAPTFGYVHFDWRGFQVTPYLGATVRYGYLFLQARVYGRVRAAEHGCGGCSGFANGSARTLQAGLHSTF